MRTSSATAAALLSTLPLVHARAVLHVPHDSLDDGKYIVKMKDTISPSVGIQSIPANADKVFSKIGAFSATLTDEEVTTLLENPNVSRPENEAWPFTLA